MSYVYTLTQPKAPELSEITYEVVADNKAEAKTMFMAEIQQNYPSLDLESCEVSVHLKLKKSSELDFKLH